MIGKSDADSIGNDCLLTIIIENAHDNSDILLPTLQFIEVGAITLLKDLIEFNLYIYNKLVTSGQHQRAYSGWHAVPIY